MLAILDRSLVFSKINSMSQSNVDFIKQHSRNTNICGAYSWHVISLQSMSIDEAYLARFQTTKARKTPNLNWKFWLVWMGKLMVQGQNNVFRLDIPRVKPWLQWRISTRGWTQMRTKPKSDKARAQIWPERCNQKGLSNIDGATQKFVTVKTNEIIEYSGFDYSEFAI